MAPFSKSKSDLPFGKKTSKRTQRLLSKLDARQVKKAQNFHSTYGDHPKAGKYAKEVAQYSNLDTDQPFYESWRRQKKIIQDKSGENRLIHEKRRLTGKTEKFIQGRLAGQGEDTPEAYVSRIRKTRGGKTVDTEYDAKGDLVSKSKIRSHGRFKENWERDTNGQLIRTHFATRRLRDGVMFRRVEHHLGKLEDGKRTLVQKRGRSSKTFERDEATGKLTPVGRKGFLSERAMTRNGDGSVQRLYRNRFGRRPETVTYLKAAIDPVTNQPKPMMKTVKKTWFGMSSIRTVPLTEKELAQQQRLREAKSASSAQRSPAVAEQTSGLPTNTVAPPPVSHNVSSPAPLSAEPAIQTHSAPTPTASVVPSPDARLTTPFVSPAPVPLTATPGHGAHHPAPPAKPSLQTSSVRETEKPSLPSTSPDARALKALMESVGGSAPSPSRLPSGHVVPPPVPSTSLPPDGKAGSIHRLNQPKTPISPPAPSDAQAKAFAALMASAAPPSVGSTSRSSLESARDVTRPSSAASSMTSTNTPASTAAASPSLPTRPGSIHRLGSSGTANTPASLDGKNKAVPLDVTPFGSGEKTSTARLPAGTSRFAGGVPGASTYAINATPPVMARAFDRPQREDHGRG